MEYALIAALLFVGVAGASAVLGDMVFAMYEYIATSATDAAQTP